MRRAHAIRLLCGLAAVSLPAGAPVLAQGAPGVHRDNGGLNGSLSRGDLAKMGGDHADDANADLPKTSPQARAKAEADSRKLLDALQISCDLVDARLVVTGTSRPAAAGKPIETRVYETACQAAFGYLLETQGTESPIAISCLAAEEARAADVAKGKPPGFFCRLPENKDVNAAVASLIAATGEPACDVAQLQLFGRSASSQSEYSEVACRDGKGFLVRVALPPSPSKTTAMSCAEAANQGIKCRLTDAGPVATPVTMETFKSALAHHGVDCAIVQIRMIGQEQHLKRYVVEYRCADQPGGQVAFLPLEGNANPYEAIDCQEAARRSIECTFSPK